MTVHVAQDEMLLNALRDLRYEVVPVSSALEEVKFLPEGSQITVTCSERLGIDSTMRLVEQLSLAGFRAVPHIPAKQVPDHVWLDRTVRRLVDAGVDNVLILGGDASPPRGPFTSAIEVLRSPVMQSIPFAQTGVAGYPEGHPLISDDVLRASLCEKAPFATYIVTQMCFSSGPVREWLGSIRSDGINLPVYIGIPGHVPRTKLLDVAARCGVGESIRYLRKSPANLMRLVFSSEYDPSGIVTDLAQFFTGDCGVTGFHVFTFNALARTEKWRQEMMTRLEG
jgi:methylenetetrahydrofolate reductase (NADPH)